MVNNNRKVNFIWVCINASILFIMDAYILNQGGIALITILISGCIFLPYSLYKQLRFGGESQYIKKYIIYVAAGLLVIFSNSMNAKFSHSQANYLVEKIELYKQENGVYPQSLEALVPKYVSKVPVAKISSMMDKFNYRVSENNNPMLSYVAFPPFGRNGYSFERKEWYSYD